LNRIMLRGAEIRARSIIRWQNGFDLRAGNFSSSTDPRPDRISVLLVFCKVWLRSYRQRWLGLKNVRT
jgi:hypothetical protein